MMTGGALAGLAGDRFGRQTALLGSMVVFGVMTLAAAMADSTGMLGVLRLLAGIGLGGAMPNAAALAAEYVPANRRPIAVTIAIVCVPLGATLAGLLGIRALPLLGWRTLFVLGGVVPIVAAVALRWVLPESPRYLARRSERWSELVTVMRRMGHPVAADSRFVDSGDRSVGRASIASLFAPEFRRDTIALWGAFFSCLLGVYLGFSWLTSLLTGAGFDAGTANTGITAFNLGGVVGALLGGLAIARFGSRAAMLTMTGVAVAAAAGLERDDHLAGGGRAPDHRDADPDRQHDQRRADDDVRAGRARLSQFRARDRRGHCGRLRPHRRRAHRLRRQLGDRLRRHRVVLRRDRAGDGRDICRARAGPAARAGGAVKGARKSTK